MVRREMLIPTGLSKLNIHLHIAIRNGLPAIYIAINEQLIRIGISLLFFNLLDLRL